MKQLKDDLWRGADTLRANSDLKSTEYSPQDRGFIYGHGFQDLDGHIWELIYMEACEKNKRQQIGGADGV